MPRSLLAQAGIDAREREAADKLQKLILEELHHRIKNTLATVSAIASQSLRKRAGRRTRAACHRRPAAGARAGSRPPFAGKMDQRGSREDRSRRHRSLRQSRLPKFTIAGPDVRMTSGAVIAIAMTLNELCTNTTKFGALSVPAGRVDIAWTLDPQTQRLHLTWTERNGPAVQAPEKRSFGTRLVETLGRQLKGDVRLTYEPSGFVYAFDVPMASLTSMAA